MRRTLILLGPGAAAVVIILVSSTRVWEIRGLTRHGTPGLTLGSGGVIALLAGLAMYGLGSVATAIELPNVGSGEAKVIRVFLKSLGVAVVYGVALFLFSRA